jgi:hypothetical protein
MSTRPDHATLWLVALAVALAPACPGCATRRDGRQPHSRTVAVAGLGDPGLLTTLGSAGPDEDNAAVLADLKARSELTAAVSNYADTALRGFLGERPDCLSAEDPAFVQFTASTASQVTGAVLRDARPAQQWLEADGTTCVLYAVAVPDVHERIVDRVRLTLAQHNPFAEPADQVASDVSRFLRAFPQPSSLAPPAQPPPGAQPGPIGRPDWLRRGYDEQHPPDRFVCAIGLGPDTEAAADSARNELVTELNGRLRSLIEQMSESEAAMPVSGGLGSVEGLTFAFGPQDLVATRLSGQWHDRDTATHYVLAALEKRTAAIALRKRMEHALAESTDWAALATDRTGAVNYGDALRQRLAALAAAQEALEYRLKAAAVAGSMAAAVAVEPGPVARALKADLGHLLAAITMSEVAGGAQWLPPGEPPREAFVVKVSAGPESLPLSGIPVRLATGLIGDDVVATAVTDQVGCARLRVSAPLARRGAGGTLAASLDLPAIAPEADLSGLSIPSLRFGYVLRSRADTRFVVSFRGPGAAPIAEAITKALLAEGLQPVPEADTLGHVAAYEPDARLSDDDVLAAFAGLRRSLGANVFLLIVWGQTRTVIEESEQIPSGDLRIVYCPFELRLLDPDLPGDAKRIVRVAKTGQGASLGDDQEALRCALKDAGDIASSHVLGALRERLGPSPSEPQ